MAYRHLQPPTQPSKCTQTACHGDRQNCWLVCKCLWMDTMPIKSFSVECLYLLAKLLARVFCVYLRQMWSKLASEALWWIGLPGNYIFKWKSKALIAYHHDHNFYLSLRWQLCVCVSEWVSEWVCRGACACLCVWVCVCVFAYILGWKRGELGECFIPHKAILRCFQLISRSSLVPTAVHLPGYLKCPPSFSLP